MTVGGVAQSQSAPSRAFNLRMHTRNQIAADIVVGPKVFRPGNLIEVKQDGNAHDSCWIAFEVGACRDDIPKDVISFEQSLASQLGLRPHGTVQVRTTTTTEHAITLVELLIKEQYLSHADLWVLTTHLGDTCVYVGKLIEFKGMRATVKQLWRHGQSQLSGFVSSDPRQTKVVFRSASASISIFVLMSREMWLCDLAGDLCFHLVVCGLLTDLFTGWKDRGCTHDITIVMATRVIYDAPKIDDFPEDVRPTIQQNGKGQFFEDVYEVIVQNERFEDWSDTLMSLNKSFIQLEQRVLRSSRTDLPRRRIAYSLEAPVLESINVVLNAMDTYRFDHRFDRTGHSLILVSSSQGVFDVEKRLKSITKKRVIESGLAVDLVCVLSQPFHPVPLLRVFESTSQLPITNENQIPFEYALSSDWINVSFYQAATAGHSVMATEKSDDADDDNLRAVAVFDVNEDDNFANPVLVAKIDLESEKGQSSTTPKAKALLNPFSPATPSFTGGTFPSDRERSSLIHANRWLHALPHDEFGIPLQVHHARYKSSTGPGRRRRPTPSCGEPSDIVTGVDWKSLILPAVLPSTAAAGLGLDIWLKEACTESPHYVPFDFADTPEEQQLPPILTTSNTAAATLKPLPSGLGFKRPQKPREVFDLLILLRLAAGFQLVLAPSQQETSTPQQAIPLSVVSTSVPAGRLEELFKIHRTPPVLMANGRYYQKLELVEVEDRVIVTKFLRTKRGADGRQVENNVHKYPFLFSVPELPSYSAATTDFANRRPDLLNLWPSLDYHATQKTTDIDLNDYSIRECFWKSYFALLPLLDLPSSNLLSKNHNNTPVDLDWAKVMDEIISPAVQYSSLARLVGYMNGLSAFRPVSQVITPASTPTETLGEKTMSHMISHLQTALDAQGLSYVESGLQPAQQVRFYTSYDAVNWLISPQQQQIYGYDSIDACMAALNDCIEAGRIFALSLQTKRLRKLYYGIFYFSFVSPNSTAAMSRSEDFVEVSFANDEELLQESNVLLSVDPSGRPSRSGHELAMIVHDSYFRPGCAFRLRLEWLFASGSFLCELVDSWHHRARSFGIHFLPVPSNAFDLSATDPLRLILEIPFLPEEVVKMVKGSELEATQLEHDANLVHEALLRHFAFTAFTGTAKPEDYFVHITGVAFIRRVPGRIEWAWNFQVSRRWQQILEHEAGDILFLNFRRVSSNCDGALLELVKQRGTLAS